MGNSGVSLPEFHSPFNFYGVVSCFQKSKWIVDRLASVGGSINEPLFWFGGEIPSCILFVILADSTD